ncbi:MAG: DUF6714 family protein [Leptolyngbyaceae cyanobacterium bins.302]|nr:DUF6714 family protein [Leptolyngbyaceae cyanobacterium bins.302]
MMESVTTSSVHYPCPCCGYRTLNLEPSGTYLICPICFWEDDGDVKDASGQRWGGSNKVCLRQAQRNFIAYGACEPQWVQDVRSPTPADGRDADWQTIDELAEKMRSALIEKITLAFQDVVLEDGVSLHEARALDDYQDPKLARQVDAHIPWQEIPDEWIEKFHDVFAFMDAKGFRHAIPAYMIWCLKLNQQDVNSFASIIMCLNSKDYQSKFFGYLSEFQKQVAFKFLEYINTFIWKI